MQKPSLNNVTPCPPRPHRLARSSESKHKLPNHLPPSQHRHHPQRQQPLLHNRQPTKPLPQLITIHLHQPHLVIAQTPLQPRLPQPVPHIPTDGRGPRNRHAHQLLVHARQQRRARLAVRAELAKRQKRVRRIERAAAELVVEDVLVASALLLLGELGETLTDVLVGFALVGVERCHEVCWRLEDSGAEDEEGEEGVAQGEAAEFFGEEEEGVGDGACGCVGLFCAAAAAAAAVILLVLASILLPSNTRSGGGGARNANPLDNQILQKSRDRRAREHLPLHAPVRLQYSIHMGLPETVCRIAEIAAEEPSDAAVPCLYPREDARALAQLLSQLSDMCVDERAVDYPFGAVRVELQQADRDGTDRQGVDDRFVAVPVCCPIDGAGFALVEFQAREDRKLGHRRPGGCHLLGSTGEPEIVVQAQQVGPALLVDGDIHAKEDDLAHHLLHEVRHWSAAFARAHFCALVTGHAEGCFEEFLEPGEPVWWEAEELEHADNCGVRHASGEPLEVGLEDCNFIVERLVDDDLCGKLAEDLLADLEAGFRSVAVRICFFVVDTGAVALVAWECGQEVVIVKIVLANLLDGLRRLVQILFRPRSSSGDFALQLAF